MQFVRSLLFRACCASLLIGSCSIFLPAASRAAAIRIAVMGDSISAGSGVSGGSPNWVKHLTTSYPSAVTFQNKAQGGATSSSVVSSQLNSVVSLASTHQIDDSVLLIGGNDAGILGGLTIALGGDPTSFINTYVNNVKHVIDSVAAANGSVHQVFGNMPDITVTPSVISQATSANVTLAQLSVLSAAIGQANAQANAYALSHNVPVLDLYSASHQLVSAIPVTLAGKTFTTAFAPDNFHPASFMQGLIANMVTTAFNHQFGQSLPLLTDQQIVRNAGFTPNTATTYFNVSPFILYPVPEPATWVLAATGSAALLAVGASQRRRRRAAAIQS